MRRIGLRPSATIVIRLNERIYQGAAKAKVPAGKVAGAAKSASKAAATPKAKRLPGLTPRQERLALEKAERDHASTSAPSAPILGLLLDAVAGAIRL